MRDDDIGDEIYMSNYTQEQRELRVMRRRIEDHQQAIRDRREFHGWAKGKRKKHLRLVQK